MMKSKTSGKIYITGSIALLGLLAALVVLSLRFGSGDISWREFFGGFFGKEGYEKISFIIWDMRLARILAGMLSGAGLSVAGLLLQNITGNRLAGPNIIGVNAGAGFSVILALFFMPDMMEALPVFAFAGAFLATMLIMLISRRTNHSKGTVILAGVAVSAILNAGISMISILDSDVLTLYNDFAVGGLKNIRLEMLPVPFLLIIIGCALALILSKDIDALTLGDRIAASLGVRTRFVRVLSMMIASACAGAVVSIAGLIGFVGLMVPHIARMIFGRKTGWLIVFSALIGMNLVIASDLLGRILFAGTEIPVGLVMAVIGVPFFLWLIVGRREAV